MFVVISPLYNLERQIEAPLYYSHWMEGDSENREEGFHKASGLCGNNACVYGFL